MKTAKTFAVIEAKPPLKKELKAALGYGAVSWLAADDNVYVLNCSVLDSAVFCRHSTSDMFFWGKLGSKMARYRTSNADAPEWVEWVKETMIPEDYLSHASPIVSAQELEKSLDDRRTFLSRARHRRRQHRDGLFLK